MSSWTRQRARVAALSRSRPPHDPTLVAEREKLREERRAEVAEQYISKLLACAPALTDAQRARLRPLVADVPEAGAA